MKRKIIIGVILGVFTSSNITNAIGIAEFTDEKEGHWSDVSVAIDEWPLNTFSIFSISEIDFYQNRLKMILGSPNSDAWKSGEVIIAWQDQGERFMLKDFMKLFDGNATGNYDVIYRGHIESISSGAELEIENLETNLRSMFNTHNLEYGIRFDTGEMIRPEMLSMSKCILEVTDGQVCRLFYRDPLPGGGASSGLLDYYPVVADYSIIKDENATDDIKSALKQEEGSENPENYSSGDIFNEEERLSDGVTSSVVATGIIVGVNGNTGSSSSMNNNEENDMEEVIGLTGEAEKGNDNAEEINTEEIEIPRLGVTVKRIDYKWLFLPVLGLILMAYWWFIAPIWRKSRKNEKKSKKSVDNI